MTQPSNVTATVALTEAAARQVADAATDDDAVGAYATDVNEAAPGEWALIAYFHGADAGRRAAFAAAVGDAGGDAGAVVWRDLPDDDWVKRSQAALTAIRAGRVLVYGEHARHMARPNDIAIHIEAGLAFGTGHHATTRGCLVAIEAALKTRPVAAALDVGTGSGVLAIAIARRGVPVLATDIDPVAVRIAEENAGLNGVADRVTVQEMPGSIRRLPVAAESPAFDLVVANILMGPLITLAPALAGATAPGGTIILSGLLPYQRVPIVATYRSVGFALRRWFIHDGWLVVVMERPAKIRRRRGR